LILNFKIKSSEAPMITALARFGPLVGISLFFAIGLGWRSWLQRRRYGQSGVILFRQPGLWGRSRDALLLVAPGLLWLLTLGQALWPGRLGLGRLAGLESGAATVAGACLLAAGVFFMTAAQLQMGKSWRIGIEEAARPGLVTWGLYRFCRNPIFAAMLIALGGLALLMPSLLTLLLWVGTYVGIRRQVAEEERYLRRAYGAEYQGYAARVGRFTPWLGRRV
jgi:protein-S-isoprenylcysteine O-methyltransferase Ste14